MEEPALRRPGLRTEARGVSGAGWPFRSKAAAQREGAFRAHPLWHASWVEVHPMMHDVFAVGLRIGAGLKLGLGEGVGGTGM